MMHLWHHENVQFNIYRRILNSVSHLKTKRPSYNYNKYEEKTMKPEECSFSFHFFAKKLFTLRWTMKASIIIIISSFPPSIDKLSHSESGVYLPHIKGVLSISLLSHNIHLHLLKLAIHVFSLQLERQKPVNVIQAASTQGTSVGRLP